MTREELEKKLDNKRKQCLSAAISSGSEPKIRRALSAWDFKESEVNEVAYDLVRSGKITVDQGKWAAERATAILVQRRRHREKMEKRMNPEPPALTDKVDDEATVPPSEITEVPAVVQKYPPITEEAEELLKDEAKYKGKLYKVDVEKIMHRLYDKVRRRGWPSKWEEQRRWWRLVYAYLKERNVIRVMKDVEREKYAPFFREVVLYCQPDAQNENKNRESNFWKHVRLPTTLEYDKTAGEDRKVTDFSEVKRLLDDCFMETS